MKNNLKKILKLGVSLAILVLLFYKLDINPSAIITQIKQPWYLALAAILPFTIIPYISANRTKLFLQQVGVDESIFTLVKINWISLFQGIILPSSQGFDVLRIYYIEKRHAESRGKAGSVVFIERMIGFILLCLLSFAASFMIDIPEKGRVLAIIGLISFALLSVVFLLLNKRVHKWISGRSYSNKYFNMVYGYCEKFWTSLTYFPYKRILWSSIIWIGLFQLASVLSVNLVFLSYGVNLPFYVHLSLYPIIAILSMVPITISGFGVREGFFVYFYSLMGVSPEVAISVSLLNYLILTIEPALVGGLMYITDVVSGEK